MVMNYLTNNKTNEKFINARQLWEDLDIKKDFSAWIKNYIETFNLIEGESYSTLEGDRHSSEPGKKRTEYAIEKSIAIKIALNSNSKKADEFRDKLSKEIVKPRQLSRLEIIELALDSEKKRIAAEEKLAIAEPKADQYDLFMQSKNSIPMGEVAKALGTGRNKLFEYLRGIGMLNRDNVPYQQYIDQLYFEVVRKIIPTGDSKPVTLVTPKGMDYISKKLQLKVV